MVTPKKLLKNIIIVNLHYLLVVVSALRWVDSFIWVLAKTVHQLVVKSLMSWTSIKLAFRQTLAHMMEKKTVCMIIQIK